MGSVVINTPITYIKLNRIVQHNTNEIKKVKQKVVIKVKTARPPKPKPHKFKLCMYCADPINNTECVKYNKNIFCSNQCMDNWKNKHDMKPKREVKVCAYCLSRIISEYHITKEDDSNIVTYMKLPVINPEHHIIQDGHDFCSEICYNKWKKIDLLTKCKKGEISFLDLPKEIRDIGIERRSYKCNSNVCLTCGTTFYTSSSLGESYRKYCSDRCNKIGMKAQWKMYGIKHSGWLSPAWRGGITNDEYCHKFNVDLRRRVRTFFDNKCFLCGKTQELNGRKLAVHHVNYNKNSCCDSSKVMLVPMCMECHGKTNYDREKWEDYIADILKEKYDYKCYYTKEEYNNLKSE